MLEVIIVQFGGSEITRGIVLYWLGVVLEFEKTHIASCANSAFSGANTNLQGQTYSKSWDHLSLNCRVWHQQIKSWPVNSYVLVSWHCRHHHHKKSLLLSLAINVPASPLLEKFCHVIAFHGHQPSSTLVQPIKRFRLDFNNWIPLLVLDRTKTKTLLCHISCQILQSLTFFVSKGRLTIYFVSSSDRVYIIFFS